MNYQQHPLSAAFPAMAQQEFQELRDSIENIGVQNPIIILDGMVIDGWHRYSACLELGMDCPSVPLSAAIDPRDFVMAQNKTRRHITQAQLALATTAVYQWKPVGNPSFSQSGTECPIADQQKTNAELSEISGVGERTIKQAKAVQTKAAPEVLEAVQRGEIGLPKAAAIAQLPKEEQATAISKPLPKKAAPAPELAHGINQEMADAVAHMAQENQELHDRLALAVMDGTEEEKAMASETIAELRARVAALEAELSAVKDVRNALMSENSELKKQVIYMKKQMGA